MMSNVLNVINNILSASKTVHRKLEKPPVVGPPTHTHRTQSMDFHPKLRTSFSVSLDKVALIVWGDERW